MIRTATLGDVAAIRDIWNTLITDTTVTFNPVPRSNEQVAAFISDGPCPVFVAQTDRVVGYATYGPFRAGAGYQHIAEHSIVLTRQAQGLGLGRRLLGAVITQAKENQINSLIAGISGENNQGLAFHKHMGFAQVGCIAQAGYKFDRWIDLVFMQKHL